jgi:hypothetical protein
MAMKDDTSFLSIAAASAIVVLSLLCVGQVHAGDNAPGGGGSARAVMMSRQTTAK